MSGPCTPLGTRTPVLELCKPADNEVGWTASLNGDLDTLDALFAAPGVLKPSAGGLGLDPTGNPNGTAPVWNGTAFAMTAIPALGATAAFAALIASGNDADYVTTSATFVDVDPVNLKAIFLLPVGVRVLVVIATFASPATVVSDGLNRVQILAAGQAVAPVAWMNNGLPGQFTTFGIVTSPASGTRSVALQFRGDGVNPFTIHNRAAEGLTAGIPFVRAQMLIVALN
jgi:hypothetical protein